MRLSRAARPTSGPDSGTSLPQAFKTPTLGPVIGRRKRRMAERAIVRALAALPGELAGEYQPLSTIDEAARERLIEAHLLFKAGDRFLKAGGFTATGRTPAAST